MVADGEVKKITLSEFLNGNEERILEELKNRVFSDIKKSNDYRTLKDLILAVEQVNSRLVRIENAITELEVRL